MTFAREAWLFVLPFLVAAVLSIALGWRLTALGAALCGIAMLLFFRIPSRTTTGDAQSLLAPANGRVSSVERVAEPALGEGEFLRVATFLSVFDVHVQRAPGDGIVTASEYRPGRKLAAFRPEAGDVNESHLTVFRAPTGDLFAVRQIAGLVARRVVAWVGEGRQVRRGDLIGLIKFGSRVDLLVPVTYDVLVEPGERVWEGLTPMATPSSSP